MTAPPGSRRRKENNRRRETFPLGRIRWNGPAREEARAAGAPYTRWPPSRLPRSAVSAQAAPVRRRVKLPLHRRVTERVLYLANPLRSANRYPAALRDNAAWEAVFRTLDPLRHA